MSNIEEEAKETLIPLLQGRHKTLLVNNRKRLAKWITLKSMIIDAEEITDMVFTNTIRVSFKDKGEIPRELKIWIAHHRDETWYSGLHHQSTRGVPSLRDASLFPSGKNIQTTAIGLGQLFVFVFYAAVPDVELKMNIGEIFPRRAVQIWPLRYQSIVWPPQALSNSETDRLGNVLKEFAASSLARFPGR
jgi:hypothetical protein